VSDAVWGMVLYATPAEVLAQSFEVPPAARVFSSVLLYCG
jgi:hypothetical protein